WGLGKGHCSFEPVKGGWDVIECGSRLVVNSLDDGSYDMNRGELASHREAPGFGFLNVLRARRKRRVYPSSVASNLLALLFEFFRRLTHVTDYRVKIDTLFGHHLDGPLRSLWVISTRILSFSANS